MAVAMQHVQKEFILRGLLDKATPIDLHARAHRATAALAEYTERDLSLSVENPAAFRERESVQAYFSSGGHVMTFRTRVRRVQDDSLLVENPRAIYRRLEREFERVEAPRGINTRVFFEGQPLGLDFPASDRFVEPSSEVNLNTQFDPGSIAGLLKSFRERTGAFAAESKIVMFRARRPSGLAERLVARSGRILALPIDDGIAHEVGVEHVLTEDDVAALSVDELTDDSTEVDEFASQLERISSVENAQQLYAPILFRQYVVGYVFVVHSAASAAGFDAASVDFVRQFCRVLAYALNENGYFEGTVRPEPTNAEVIDISASGMLFSLPHDYKDTRENQPVEIAIDSEGRTVNIESRVVRIFGSADRTFVGVRFTKLDREDSTFLFTLLYGEDYDGSIEQPKPEDNNVR